MKISVNRTNGVSLIELLIGMTILLIVSLFTALLVKNATRSNLSNSVNAEIRMAIDSLTDQISTLAISQWSTLRWELRLELKKPTYEIWSSVGNIESETRTRPVTIQVKRFENGSPIPVSIRDYVSKVTNQRGKLFGAIIPVKVIVAGSSPEIGVKGVYIQAEGQESDWVNGTTDDFGFAALRNVKVGTPQRKITMKFKAIGNENNCYFPSPPSFEFEGLSDVETTANTVHPLMIVPMIRPNATVTGRVLDVTAGIPPGNVVPIQGYKVGIVSLSGTLAIPSFSIQKIVDTNNLGQYSFSNLFVGKYVLYFIGNPSSTDPYGTFPAASEPGNKWTSPTSFNINITGPDQGIFYPTTANPDVYVKTKGAVLTSNIGVARNFNGTNFQLNSSDGNDDIILRAIPVTDAYTGALPGTKINLLETTEWEAKWRFGVPFYDTTNPYWLLTTDSNGNYSKANIMPHMIRRMFSSNYTTYEHQYGKLYFLPSRYISSSKSYVPVLVLNPTSANPKFAFRHYDVLGGEIKHVGTSVTPFTGGVTAAKLDDFSLPIEMNQSITGPELGWLHRDELCELEGTVTGDDGHYNNPSDTPPYNPPPTLKMHVGGSGNTGLIREWHSLWYVNAFSEPSIPMEPNGHFDTLRTVVPTLGPDKITLTYEREARELFTASLSGTAEFYTKMKNVSGKVIYQQVPQTYFNEVSHQVTIPRLTLYFESSQRFALNLDGVSIDHLSSPPNQFTKSSSDFMETTKRKGSNIPVPCAPRGTASSISIPVSVQSKTKERYLTRADELPMNDWLWTFACVGNPCIAGLPTTYQTGGTPFPDKFSFRRNDDRLNRLYFNQIVKGNIYNGQVKFEGKGVANIPVTLTCYGVGSIATTTNEDGLFNFVDFRAATGKGINCNVKATTCDDPSKDFEVYQGIIFAPADNTPAPTEQPIILIPKCSGEKKGV